MRATDLTGQRFGRLVVIGRAPPRNKYSRILCRCDCGNEKIIGKAHVVCGVIKSCGCILKEVAIFNIVDRVTKFLFKERDKRTYSSWAGMVSRCHGAGSKTKKGRKNYAARGITVCDRWRFGENGEHPFQCFLKDMGIRPPGKTLDREDNNGNYTPDNCRWATSYEQNNNQRRTIRIPVEELDALRVRARLAHDPDQPWLG